MDLKDIKKIMELMDTHGLTQFKLEQDDSKLELSKRSGMKLDEIGKLMAMAQPHVVHSAHPSGGAAPSPVAGGGDANDSGDGIPAGLIEIPSPMVGTFYRAASPESGPFVQTGDSVEESSVVCIIEAMKVMNEIQSEVKGTIVEVLVENGTPVQYGEPLFRVRPA